MKKLILLLLISFTSINIEAQTIPEILPIPYSNHNLQYKGFAVTRTVTPFYLNSDWRKQILTIGFTVKCYYTDSDNITYYLDTAYIALEQEQNPFLDNDKYIYATNIYCVDSTTARKGQSINGGCPAGQYLEFNYFAGNPAFQSIYPAINGQVQLSAYKNF